MIRTRGGLTAVISLCLCLGLHGCGEQATSIIPGVPGIGEPGGSLKRAVELYQQKSYAEAEAQAQKASKEQKDYGFACIILAQSKCAQGKFAEAEPLAREGVRYEPGVANSHAVLARALNGLLGFKEAEQQARQALALPEATKTPSSRAEQHNALAYALSTQLRLSEAEAEFKAAIQADPNYPAPYVAYGGMLNVLGRYSEAAQMLENAVRLDPLDLVAKIGLVVADTNLNRFEEAIKLTDELATKLPADPNVPVLLGNIYLKQGKAAEAEAEARKAAKMNPLLGPAYALLAGALYKEGKLIDAEMAGMTATKLTPMDANAQLTLARILADEKKWYAAGYACTAAGGLSVLNRPLNAECQKLGVRIWANAPKPQWMIKAAEQAKAYQAAQAKMLQQAQAKGK